MKCPICLQDFEGRKRKYCSYECMYKRTRKPEPRKNCSQCGKIDAVYRGRLFCDPCIKLRRDARRKHPSEMAEKTRRDRRLKREALAPGLTVRQRQLLLRQWVSERQPCVYCVNSCDTVDHIIPLSQGGTNYESNLIPACRKCNSSKGNKLISEWKNIYDGAKA